jgi:hypothetical protein
MNPDLQEEIKRRLDALPQVVRDAIANIDVQKQMRAVSDNHDLHIDQWASLEKEVMLTLLGIQESQDLPQHIQKAIGVSAEEADNLAKDIGVIVFEPIREELERQLEHPDAKEDTKAAAQAAMLTAGGVVPATPPPAKPTEKAVRAPLSSTYTSREPSSNRSSVNGDPYREPPI